MPKKCDVLDYSKNFLDQRMVQEVGVFPKYEVKTLENIFKRFFQGANQTGPASTWEKLKNTANYETFEISTNFLEQRMVEEVRVFPNYKAQILQNLFKRFFRGANLTGPGGT